MSQQEGRFTKGRVEAFSDGVIAVIITIMVLDLKAPESGRLDDLAALWPSFASYLISFIFAAVYWINHHDAIAKARRATPSMIWANNLLLFCMSLFPFATAYVASSRLSPLAMVFYGSVQFACSLSFALLDTVIAGQRKGDPAFDKERRAGFWKHLCAKILYALAIPAGYYSPIAALLIFGGIGVIYAVPSLLVFASD
jgi:uncharacterized membrane protein